MGGPGGSDLRSRLIEIALEWEDYFGVAPSITSSLSELDGARLIGMAEGDYRTCGRNRTAIFNYSCQPTGLPDGSKSPRRATDIFCEAQKRCQVPIALPKVRAQQPFIPCLGGRLAPPVGRSDRVLEMVAQFVEKGVCEHEVPHNGEMKHNASGARSEPSSHDVVYHDLDPGRFAFRLGVVEAEACVPGILAPCDPGSFPCRSPRYS